MSKIKIEIKNLWTGLVLFEWESENNTIKETVTKAITSGANLIGANLIGANLSDANLSDANLSYANLSRADLSGANLSGANLSGANLIDANLIGANLSRANLSGANLSGANLSRADLIDANLSGANLSRANLSKIKYDLFGRLLTQKEEVKYLKEKLISGEIDGSIYEGECCCFVGTLANAKKCNYNNLVGLQSDSTSPTEKWFLAIKKGDTPSNSQISKITLEWIEEFELILSR